MTDAPGGRHRGNRPPGVAAAPPPPASAETVVVAETVEVATEWVVAGHVRVRRRVVTERRMVEVEVRREVLELDGEDLDVHDGRLFGAAVGPVVTAAPPDRPPIVVMLHEQVPRVVHDIRPYERVTVTTERVTNRVTVHDDVRREVVDVDVVPARDEL